MTAEDVNFHLSEHYYNRGGLQATATSYMCIYTAVNIGAAHYTQLA